MGPSFDHKLSIMIDDNVGQDDDDDMRTNNDDDDDDDAYRIMILTKGSYHV